MYVYDDLRKDCCRLCKAGVVCGSIGKTACGNHILCFHVGKESGPQIIITGGIHAREWVTALLVVRQAYAYRKDSDLGIFFVPMVNPDGCTLAQSGCNVFPEHAQNLLKLNGGNDNFSMWKANILGVDLNCNFNARFGTGKGNTSILGAESCVGNYPESELETAALVQFTRAVKPVMTVSYHAQGREVYYEFGQTGDALSRDRRIAKSVADYLGYKLVDGDLGSAGGYKDWCVQELHIPAITIEIIPDNAERPPTEKSLNGEEKNIWLPTILKRALRKENLC